MSREGQRGRRRSNFAVARNRLNIYNRDSLVRNWSPATGLVPIHEPTDPYTGGIGPGYNATGNTSTNTPSIQLASVNDGDLNIVAINVASGTNLTDPGVPTFNGTAIAAQGSTNADGWLTVVTSYDDGSPGTRLTVVAKVFQSGDPTTFQWAWTVASNYAGGSLWVQSGTFDATNPIPSADIQTQVTASTSYPTPSITTSVRGVLYSVAGCRTNGEWTPGDGDTRRLTEMRSSTSNIALADAVVPVDAGTYSKTWTNTASTAQANLGIFLVASATVATGAPATVASGTGTANDATVKVTPNAAEATASGAANDATTDSTSFITGGSTGNSTGPSVTFPSTIASGQVITLMLMLNNTDNITASPSELTTLDSMGLSGSGQGTSYLYRMVADGTTASSTLSWTLAATRNWSIAYVAHNDVDQDPTNPFVGFNSASDTVTATSSFTAPSATSTGVGYALEFMGVKANGTAIGLFTEPSGWTKRQQVLNSNTFGSNIAIGTRNGNPVAAGTYGSDVWTTDVTATTSFRYTIVLPQTPGTAASTGDAIAYDAAPSVVVNAAEATATGAAAWDAGDTVDAVLIGDNPIFVTGTAYDATVSTAVITNAPAAEATATGTANDAGTLVSPLSTGATGSGAANDAGNGVAAIASEATATGAAADAGNAVQFTATEATSAGAAGDTSSAVLVTPMEATATGTAYDATVSASANGAATPTEAAAAGAAFDAIIAVSFTPTEAAALATAANALGRVAATVGAAIVAGDAGNIAAGGPPTGGSHGGAGSPRASSGTGPDRPTGGDTAARPHGGHGPARATSSTPPSRARGG